MKHLDDGQLRAALDGEASPEATIHLDGCPGCQERLERLRAEIRPVQQRLSFFAAPPGAAGPNPRVALARLRQTIQEKKEKSMSRRIFASPLFRVGLTLVVLLALVLSVPATRAWAGEFLGIFRVQRVVTIPVDSTGFDQLTDNPTLSKQIGQLMSSSVTVAQNPGAPVHVSSAEEASQKTGFTVRLPKQGVNPDALSLTVQGASAYTVKVDRAKAQAVLDEAGRKDLVLPQSLDGADLSIQVPASARAAYGVCPSEDSATGITGNNQKLQQGLSNMESMKATTTGVDVSKMRPKGSLGRQYPDCIMLAEIPSPTINTPPDVNLEQLAVIGLEFSGMTHQQAQEFSQTVDWTTSLVIPIPRNAATYKTVTVDGVQGTLIERPADDAPQFALIWVKNGIVYAIGGLGNHAEQALQMANSLQ